jgi:hypothetical protein
VDQVDVVGSQIEQNAPAGLPASLPVRQGPTRYGNDRSGRHWLTHPARLNLPPQILAERIETIVETHHIDYPGTVPRGEQGFAVG